MREITLPRFASMDEAFRGVLSRIATDGNRTEQITDRTSVGSRFGEMPRTTIEIVAAGFSLTNPRRRWVTLPGRDLNRAFAIANTLWTLSGSNQVKDIAFYNQRGIQFAQDGILKGAMGARIFVSPVGNQVDRVISTLREFPASRRAVVQIYAPTDLADPPKDTPCTISLQYLLRAGQLEAITSMRSQSAALLLPYDVFLFTMIQEAVAAELGAKLGTYHHFCGSLHYYDDEQNLVSEIIRSDATVDDESEMIPMPVDALVGARAAVLAERDIREAIEGNAATPAIGSYGLPPYWAALLEVVVQGIRRTA